MKKILLLLSLVLFLFAGYVQAEGIKKATVFHPITGERKAVVVGDPHAFDGGFVLEIAEGYKLLGDNELGFSVITSYKTTLSASMTSSQSTISASSMATKDGETITMGVLGSKVFLTIEPGGNKEEIVMCTGISGSSWTGCTRGLAFYGTSTTAVAANAKTHSSGSVLIMSNVHYVYDELVDKDTADSIDGVKTFASTTIPRLDAYRAPTDNAEFVPKKYVDDTVSAGAPNATESVKGLLEIGTQIEVASTTSSGSEARLAIPASMSTSTPGSNAGLQVVVSENDGKINQDWLDLSESFVFTNSTTTMNFASTTGISVNSVEITSTSDELNKLDGTSANVTSTNFNYLTDGTSTTTLHRHPMNAGYTASGTPGIGNMVITHNLGAAPSLIKINAIADASGDAVLMSWGSGVSATSESSLNVKYNGAGFDARQTNDQILYLDDSNAAYDVFANITAVSSTTFTLTFTTFGASANDVFIQWEAWR